jgi:epsin
MDFASLKDKVSNLTLYDIKAGVRQVQNGIPCPVVEGGFMLTGAPAVMNYTEMEAKVREATNNEPWGTG